MSTIEVPGVFCCPVCHKESLCGVPCPGCVCLTSLASHVAMMQLTEESLIHRLIHLYKYQYIESFEEALTLLIDRFFKQNFLFAIDYLVPVPLHRKRYVERGFNQSERIAHIVSTITHIPVQQALRRSVNTVQQATLDRKGRRQNVKDAFEINPIFRDSIDGKRILLIDDVYTTGSTLNECAYMLMRAGALRVSGWSVARG